MALLALLAAPLAAQVALPGVQVPDPGGVLGGVTDTARDALRDVEASARREAAALLRARERDLSRLLRRNRDTIERDARGDLARRGELLATGLDMALVPTLNKAGFTVLSSERIEGLDLSVVRLGVPPELPLADAEALARRLAPGADISADNLHFQSGAAESAGGLAGTAALQAASSIGVDVGVIDGAPGPSVRVLQTKGFAKGAPVASNHGSAVASLLKSAGATRIRVADVYGTDPAGGNALAMAKGLGYLVAAGSRVITISLVGPRNAVLEKAIAATQRKGVVVVAAVGNDGPAAPPAYPASYPGVVAVTGVDKHGRALIEAGRALHLDYAAPGADVYGLDARGKPTKLRGTSFAAPLAAARLAAALQAGGNWRRTLDAETRDLGRKGPDPVFGRGLLCGGCAQKK
ncbi:extracellular protease [Erythrobacter litoralis HTCC2594]|uniref:Extracellular protease n=2 Tax=Erythrobacter litoralis TaxID=39960 RepID=Q2NC86_ERYLH|nr:extracellular protease [Erythrobacter litoralis HTCC2594]